MIDLHCHSTASDGTLSPAELVRAARKLSLGALALTDHDTVAGLGAFLAQSAAVGLLGIPGVEVATRSSRGDPLHLVGLFVDHTNAALAELLRDIRARRCVRNGRIIEALAGLGYPLDPARLGDGSGEGVIGRPHIAKALVDAGRFQRPQQVFDTLLGRGRPAYVPRDVPSAQVCLSCLRQAGAVTVWAHPMVGNSMTNAKVQRIAAQLKGYGLDAMEAYYPEHSDTNTAAILGICRRLGLLVSGGSDFHGDTMPTISLGTGRGALAVPDALLEPLRERARCLRQSGC